MDYEQVEIRFVNQKQISDHLNCVICQCFFKEPTRLGCGHTYCYSCIKQCIRSNQATCPECRQRIDHRLIKRDLIAYNLLNDELVFCVDESKFCKWKGKLLDLGHHMMECDILKNGVPEYLKDIEEQNKKDEGFTQEQQFLGEKFEDKLNQNDNGSLLQRLFSKNKDGLAQVLDKKPQKQQQQEIIEEQKQKEDDIEDFLNFLDNDDEDDEKRYLSSLETKTSQIKDKDSISDKNTSNGSSQKSKKTSGRKKRAKSSNEQQFNFSDASTKRITRNSLA